MSAPLAAHAIAARTIHGDSLEVLPQLEPGSVQVAVTSPPYWRKRRYTDDSREIGQEASPEEYVANMVDVLRPLRTVLRPDGVLWLNVGDTYAAGGNGGGGCHASRQSWQRIVHRTGFRQPPSGYKRKDLTLSPFQLAMALREDGWCLRSTIIWSKPSAVEPLREDRPADSHEYLFLLSVSERYRCSSPGEKWWGKTVWEIAPDRSALHEATMPEELARRCIVCSSAPGDTVIDPFSGNGTTGRVSVRLGRSFIGVELHAEHAARANRRAEVTMPLPFDAGVPA